MARNHPFKLPHGHPNPFIHYYKYLNPMLLIYLEEQRSFLPAKLVDKIEEPMAARHTFTVPSLLCIMALLVTFYAEPVSGLRFINYRPIEEGDETYCGGIFHWRCQPKPINPYTRGCETFDRCRDGNDQIVQSAENMG